jgi:hypothetical protein
LLDYAVERAADVQIVRTVSVQSEKNLGFAAVHQLLLPLLHLVQDFREFMQAVRTGRLQAVEGV